MVMLATKCRHLLLCSLCRPPNDKALGELLIGDSLLGGRGNRQVRNLMRESLGKSMVNLLVAPYVEPPIDTAPSESLGEYLLREVNDKEQSSGQVADGRVTARKAIRQVS
jgi:hypothetical protein